jgi:hypothetical protein
MRLPRLRRFYERLLPIAGLLFLLAFLPKDIVDRVREPILGVVVLMLLNWNKQQREWLEREKDKSDGTPPEG